MDTVESQLTAREDEVLKLVGKGFSNKEIGAMLECSPMTVKKHMENVCRKLRQPSRIKAFHAHAEMCKDLQQELMEKFLLL